MDDAELEAKLTALSVALNRKGFRTSGPPALVRIEPAKRGSRRRSRARGDKMVVAIGLANLHELIRFEQAAGLASLVPMGDPNRLFGCPFPAARLDEVLSRIEALPDQEQPERGSAA